MQNIFVIAGPTNAGKDTIIKQLLLDNSLNLSKVVTSTSRKIRHNEIDGKDYHFYSKEIFESKIKNSDFFEYAVVHSDYKGIEKASIFSENNLGKNIILQLNLDGFLKLRNILDKNVYNLVGIFIMPPSIEELKRRMQLRNTENDISDIELRLKNAEIEIKNSNIFDFIVKNDVLDTAVTEVKNIIKALI